MENFQWQLSEVRLIGSYAFVSTVLQTRMRKATQQHDWKAQDGMQKCRARLCILNLIDIFSSFCCPRSSTRPVAKAH